MAKCSTCEADLPPLKAKCLCCGAWAANFDEGSESASSAIQAADQSVTLDQVTSSDWDRLSTGPWDECFGCNDPEHPVYGIVRGSVTLIGGSPGAGKSTLSLQMADSVAGLANAKQPKKANPRIRDEDRGKEVLYIASEEQLKQIKQRADRLKLNHQTWVRMVPAMTGAVDLDVLLKRYNPILMVLDSLKGMVGEDNDLAIKTCKVFKEFAMLYNCPGIVLTHVTKGDVIAGKLTIQHEVDTTMTFFPDPEMIDESGEAIRVLDVQKNRCGPAFVKLYFHMTSLGLVPADVSEESDEEE